ncbi:MAG: protein kinase, partial [Rhodoferax sp.]|nr:protein kinase [Rhodoferax sp.]
MNAAHVAGRRVGRFELLRQLGRGAQATVWLGYDARLDREVAIKLLDPQAAELQEWLHEARAVSRLTHPNIVPVFEADTADGQPMLVFEYVDGGTLADA